MPAVTDTAAAPLLQHLNPSQRLAVTSDAPALLVIAGAGTGKTRVLTHRIAYAIAAGWAKPWEILAATFTNKAAGEMRERVDHLTHGQGRLALMGTFHRICAQFLRTHHEGHPYGRSFAIYDQGEQLTVLKQAMRELSLDPKLWLPSALLARISHHKSAGLTLEKFQREMANTTVNFIDEQIVKLFPIYQGKLTGAQAMDFDDLILEGTRLIQSHAPAREQIRRQYRWVFVDEFQDINQAQWDLIKAIAGTPQEAPHAHLFAVGDDDQAIYGFRGAHAGFLDDFQSTYHPAIVILEDNYRSTEPILAVANRMLKEKTWGPLKSLRATSGDGPRPWAFLASSDVEEALEVGHTIERLVRGREYEYRQMAVLYRRNAQSRTFEEVFTRLAIPHQVVGGQRFYQRQEVKDVLAYLRLIHNDRDTAALGRAINSPRRGIGDKTVDQLTGILERNGIGLLGLLEQPNLLNEFSGRARAAVGGFLELILRLKKLAEQTDLKQLLESVLTDSGYELALKASPHVEDQARLENLDELRGAVADFVEAYPQAGLAEYLEEKALIADVDSFNANADAVTLMTLHAAKGLEFAVVFLVGMEEGLLPHFRAIEEGILDEELRLTYVGITRAKERLYISAAQSRRNRGVTQESRPSQFLRYLDPALLEGDPLHLALLTSELKGSGWSQEGGVGWRRSLQTERAVRDSKRTPRWQSEDWPLDDLAEPLPGERRGVINRKRIGSGTQKIDDLEHRAKVASLAAPAAPPSAYTVGASVQHQVWGTGIVQEIKPSGRDNFLMIKFRDPIGVKMLAESKAPLTKSP
ncbi:MAG TPA: UvrD-helicase domain-containing protein [bacterium]|nr:UvrD-helicase domain-containing protein [bacterium]